MRHKRIKNLIVGGALIGALFVTKASAYDAVNTHPALTNEIVNFYNLNFSQKLSDQDKSWIIQGSTDEDNGIRSLNHFYDPIHNIGMAGAPTSKQWAMSSGAQSNFFAISSNLNIAEASGVINSKSPDDFSYPRVMDDYAQGDRQRAMIGFGHLLHLLEDANVPDHTRNDPHPPILGQESPYEKEMEKWNPGNFSIVPELKKDGLKPVILSNMGDYFDKLAKYSNGNFFSEDTILSSEYEYPHIDFWADKKINGEVITVGFKKDKTGQYALVQKLNKPQTRNLFEERYYSLKTQLILDGYWDRLSKDEVLNGAGALNLFLTEAEKAKQEFANKPPEKNWFAKLLGLVGINILTTSDGIATSDVKNSGVDNSSYSDTIVTPTPKVTNQQVSPTPLVTKTPSISVTTVSPTPLPLKTPVPTPKQSATPTPSPISILQQTEKVNINTANKDLLMTLNGIKDAKSDAIIQYRQTNGLFQKVEDIMNVSGIGQSIFNDIKDLITVGNIVPTPTPLVVYGGGGGGGGSSSPTPTPSPSVTPTPSPSPTSTSEPGGDTANLEDVVINEIAWMGTASSANDEWMELRNTTGQTVNLTGWILKSTDETPNITLSGSISPSGFFLLERTSDETLPSINANQIYTGALGNTGEHLVLKDIAGTTIDQVDGSNGWKINGSSETIGSNDTKETAQRMAGGWITAQATPKAQNSENIVLKPYAVADLVAGHHSPTITATWSAPDSGSYNVASLSYDMRYSAVNFPDANTWDTATKVASSSLPNVGEKGASQSASFAVAYEYGQTLYFALKTGLSDISNIATVSFPSAIDANAWSMFGKDQYHTSFAADITGPGSGAAIIWGFEVGSAPSLLANVFRSNGLNASCPNGGDNIRLFDYLHNSLGAYPCSGQYFNTWGSNFNSSFNDTTFTEFEQVGTLPCGTYDECKNAKTTLAVRQVVLRADGWTAPPTGSINNAVVSADGDIYFGASDGSSNKLFKLDKNGAKQWEYASNVSIGMPAVLSDGTVYFGRIGAGGVLAFMALNPDGSKKWDFNDASTVKAVTVSSKGEPYFTYQSGAQDKLAVLKPDGSVKTLISGTGLSNFSPVVLENGNIITASYVSGNQFFTAYSSAGLQLWNLAYTGVNGNIPSNPSYEKTTGKTYSAAGSKLFDIPSGGAVLNAHQIDLLGTAATMVAISSDTLYVGFNDINPASGSRLFAINKSDLTIKWAMPFSANSRMNGQLAVDKDDNIYFSTEGGSVYAIDKLGSQKWKIDTGMASVISPVLTENGIIWGYGNRLVEIK